MPSRLAIEACILVGGRSSRMGRDKALLRLGRKSLLAHVRAAAEVAGFKARIIRKDLKPGCGPLGGIHTALRTTAAEAVLFLSCDMPFVSGGLLRRVRAKLEKGACAVFVQVEQIGFPFAIRREAVADVEALLEAKELSLRALARRLKAASLRLRGKATAGTLNINTPEDYERARKQLDARRHGPGNRTSK